MTIAERNNKLKHFITCLKCELSGKSCDVNCSIQYDAGNMSEIIENLEAISKALEQETILDKIRAEVEALNQDYYCEGDFDKCKDYVLDILDEYRGE